MERQAKSSRQLLFVGLAATFGLIFAIALVAYALFGSTRRDDTADTSATASEKKVASKQEVAQNLKDLDASIKQSATDQTAAKAVLKASESQTKVGN